jgi:hypothetical protein
LEKVKEPDTTVNWGIPKVKDSRSMTPYAELLNSISGITLDDDAKEKPAMEVEEDGFLYDLYAVEEAVSDSELEFVATLDGVFLEDDETWAKDGEEEGEEDSNDEDNWQNEYGEEEESDENWHEDEERVSDNDVCVQV